MVWSGRWAFFLPFIPFDRLVGAGIGDVHAITGPAAGHIAHHAHVDMVSATLCSASLFLAVAFEGEEHERSEASRPGRKVNE